MPNELHSEWNEYRENLHLLNELTISRCIVINNHKTLELHGFADASEKGYGACFYMRSINNEGQICSRLICSKSRVAPLKSISLPRLELCAALLLSKLFETVKKSLQHFVFEKIIFYSDSTITLNWINTSPHTLKTFVGNRFSEIRSITASYE